MKIYKYFLQRKHVPKLINDLRGDEEAWVLYAFTNKKEYAKKWEATRNMKRFRKITNSIDKDEYLAYRSKYLMNELTEINCVYFKSLNDKDYSTIDMVLTNAEDQVFQSVIDDDQLIGEPCTICPAIFADKYYKALKILGYVQWYKRWLAYNDSKYLAVMSELIREKDPDDDYGVDEFAIDEVGLILFLFPELF